MSNIMHNKNVLLYVGDFETSVYDGQTETEVWASGLCPVGCLDEDVAIIHNNLFDTIEYLFNLNAHVDVFYHNLKFDGSFLIDYFLREMRWETAFDETTGKFIDDKKMKNLTFKYVISDMGQWYSITVKTHKGKYIRFKDSLKLLPLSVAEIGKSFNTKYQKLSMEYRGERHSGGVITAEEETYLKHDLFVMSEALDITFKEGHTKLTIGSCCLAEFKKGYDKNIYEQLFPDLTQVYLPNSNMTYDAFIRKTYFGGWCHAVPDKRNKKLTNGCTLDVNSLYPSSMHSDSGNRYPVGMPRYWKGDYIPSQASKDENYYFIHLKCCFQLKEGYLPFIHIRNSAFYNAEENLETSDIYDTVFGDYNHFYVGKDGITREAVADLYLTETDFKLLKEHYNLSNVRIIEGCFFRTEIGLFDDYINKYAEIKKNSKGGKRLISKLFLNNLYGQMAKSTQSNFKVAYLDENENVKFRIYQANDKKAVYIPVGSCITSFSRNFTIRTAQKNYHGIGQRGFCYADTDSIHCDIDVNEIKGVTIHPSNFNCWKAENYWSEAVFVRQKTYLERVTHEDGELVEKPYLNIRCAGMPKSSKDIFARQVESGEKTIMDFSEGLLVEGKLLPKRIKGGIVLQDTNFKMRPKERKGITWK